MADAAVPAIPGVDTGGEEPGTLRLAPEESHAFAVASIAEAATVTSDSDGDLWPTAWADDGALYSACGDGVGVDDGSGTASFGDIVVCRIDGDPATGVVIRRLAAERDVSPVWTDPSRYNSKPTGMVAVDGNADGRDELYLAVQDLRAGTGPDTFNEAPAAGIVRSDDYGRTWHLGPSGPAPMFTGRFTTVMFLDFGQSARHVTVLRTLVPHTDEDPSKFVYAYGIDHNWRTSYSAAVPDPVDLYLARVPIGSIQDRTSWQFCSGHGTSGPAWTAALEDAVPVLTDTRRVGTARPLPGAPAPIRGTRIAQGSIVYNPGLRRFLYSSWTEFTFELYESPTPWGPWKHALSHDFGPFPWRGPLWSQPRHGGYATTIPSKFLSEDGRMAWVQSNWFVGASTYGGSAYHFSLRPLRLDPMPDPLVPAVGTSGENLAHRPDAYPVVSSCRDGRLDVLRDGRVDRAEDSWNGLVRESDAWGYTWPITVRCDRVVLTSGPMDHGSGWFASTPVVEVRTARGWERVADAVVSPPYPCSEAATGRRTYEFTFSPRETTGVRIAGPAGGWGGYTAVAELAVLAPDEAPSASTCGSIR
ncbi:DUF4185 domain-containing protein [Ruania alkalisoli]|uniref:DUF4185 domain-containing protein n=1 Tax=Ruania alkalisoli TaxID=2779775 RepID=A0A7M1SPC0_9MICO|nr:DUF4185 domain-containing protein [Ruania alkalisoli]QOR69281.1 DUF4185 domain-containing protein [Ruania alkalisoli]